MRKTLVAFVSIGAVLAVQADIFNLAFTTDQGNKTNSIVNGTPYDGSNAPMSYVGTTWNEPDYIGTYSNLRNSDGVATGLAIETTGVGLWSYDAPGDLDALDTYIYANGGSTITISGMLPSSVFDIWILSQDQNPAVSSFTLGGDTQVATTIASPPDTFIEGVNYVKFYSVVAGAGGDAVISYGGALNGIQIWGTAVIPEPSTISLLGVFGGVIVFIRRKLTI